MFMIQRLKYLAFASSGQEHQLLKFFEQTQNSRMNKDLMAFMLLDKPVLRDVVQIYDAHRQYNCFEDRTISHTKDFRTSAIPAMDDDEFRHHFRMKRATFISLLALVEKHLPKPFEGYGANIIPPDERLYIAIWFFASSEGYRQLAKRFGTSESTVHESIDMMINAFSKELHDIVQFPTTERECEELSFKFQEKNGFPGIVGVLDGTHIQIRKPQDQPDTFVNRKGRHSINLTAIADSERRFLYYSVGCPGSFHDQRVFRLGRLMELVEALPPNYHVLGDSAYALSTHLIVPYKDNNNLTVGQKSFNLKHSSNRIVVEHLFGIFKMRFPRVQSVLNVASWERAVAIVIACVQLHNFIQNKEHYKPITTAAYEHVSISLSADKHTRRDQLAGLLNY